MPSIRKPMVPAIAVAAAHSAAVAFLESLTGDVPANFAHAPVLPVAAR